MVEVFLKPDKIKDWRENVEFRNIPSSGPQFVFTIGSLDKFEENMETIQMNIPDADRISPIFVKKRSLWTDVWSVFPFLMILL